MGLVTSIAIIIGVGMTLKTRVHHDLYFVPTQEFWTLIWATFMLLILAQRISDLKEKHCVQLLRRKLLSYKIFSEVALQCLYHPARPREWWLLTSWPLAQLWRRSPVMQVDGLVKKCRNFYTDIFIGTFRSSSHEELPPRRKDRSSRRVWSSPIFQPQHSWSHPSVLRFRPSFGRVR